MDATQEQLLNQLLESAKTLRPGRLLEALHFVGYLRSLEPAAAGPARGSARALLGHAGSFQLVPGELDQILAELSEMRELDIEPHAGLSA
jgi:hypothetical protein